MRRARSQSEIFSSSAAVSSRSVKHILILATGDVDVRYISDHGWMTEVAVAEATSAADQPLALTEIRS